MRLLLVLILLSYYCFSQKTMLPEDYIATYKEDAVKEMYLHKVPACITLAQGMLESGNGNSTLCREANNHFGIKCHKEWGGETYTMDDDEHDECFRKYDKALDSYSDHSLFLSSRSRYAFLFELSANDYKGWCYGLKEAGYATDPKYAERLIELIERYQLQNLNVLESANTKGITINSTIKPEQLVIRETYRFNRIRFVVVKNDDSFYKIAHDFNLELEKLLEFNDLSKTDKLHYGDKIYIQRKRRKALEPYHVVQRNETIKSISQLHGIRINSLCKKNNLKATDMLKVGDVLFMRQSKVVAK